MEILSTGEKIKRARVYKGLTLKDICGDKISVSKMSCIENNKVAPEDWILEYISKKLDLSIEFLKYDVRKQIESNIEAFEKVVERDNYSEDVKYNIEYSEEYGYYDLACKLYKLLVNYYISRHEFENLSHIIPHYYNTCEKTEGYKYQIMYYMDIAKYLFNTNEYAQACSYYKTVRKLLTDSGEENGEMYFKATYDECITYMMLGETDKAKEMKLELEKILLLTDKKELKVILYEVLALINVPENMDKFYEYKEKCLKGYDEIKDIRGKCFSMQNIAEILFKNKFTDDAVKIIKEAIENFPEDDMETQCVFYQATIMTLIENRKLEYAHEITDKMVNIAIILDNQYLIERAYYYKAVVLQGQKNYVMAETYMNLSYDVLMKFGDKREIYKRYLEMGNMYYELGEVKESIKFFNLALQLEKRL